MSDKTLTCVECNSEFAFSAEDQAFHAQKGYTDPKRCPSCRSARRSGGGGAATAAVEADTVAAAAAPDHPAVCPVR
jgi:hypothetical protein